MAGLAALGEGPFVRVGVTIGALAKSQAGEARLVVSAGRVALLTSHLRMQSGQRKLGFAVVELRDVFPILEIVALLAVLPQSPVMLVLVAGDAGLRKA